MMPLSFGSICSGIESVSVAWEGLPFWPAFYSEIEAAPIAVLKARHRTFDIRAGVSAYASYPQVPLWGDFSALRVRHMRRFGIPMPDLLVGGTPCQAFSFAGKRLSMADDRGNLSLALVRLAHAIDNVREREGKPGLIILWENVPGVLSTADNAYGCILGGFVGADAPVRSPLERGRWPDAGMVAGPRARAAWRVLDAQYFGLAQRRERVFLVVGFRNVIDPAAVLFEPRGLLGNSPPRRQAGQNLAGSSEAGAGGSGIPEVAGTLGMGQDGGFRTTDLDQTGAFIPMLADPVTTNEGGTYTHEGKNFRTRNLMAFGGNNTQGEIEVSTALRAKGGTGHGDFESETFVAETIPFDTTQLTHPENRSRPKPGDPSPTLAKGGHPPAVAFTCKDYGQDARADGVTPTLRAMSEVDGNQNAGGQLAVALVAFQERFRGDDGRGYDRPPPALIEQTGALDTVKQWNVATPWAVRRLMPVECERLQGFPDGYTSVRYRGGMMKDGPRYRALGNAMAVPVIRWIGRRILLALSGEK